MKWCLLLCFFVAPAFGQVCKSTQYDMLKWMAPQTGHKERSLQHGVPHERDLLLGEVFVRISVGR